jgi:hypothetical protein
MKNLTEIYENHLTEFYSDDLLKEHRFYVEDNNLGFGERPFHVIWREIIKKQNTNFKFLEIGVYKGQVLSLVKLLSNFYEKNIEFYGVTPLDNSGDRYSNYENTDYKSLIQNLFNRFNLDFDLNKNLIIGDSNNELIKDLIRLKGLFDVVYIDGCHDYKCVVSDINLMKEITKVGSLIVFDDSSCNKDLPNNFFKGHLEVCQAITDYLENDSDFVEEICVGHNRVFKRITK